LIIRNYKVFKIIEILIDYSNKLNGMSHLIPKRISTVPMSKVFPDRYSTTESSNKEKSTVSKSSQTISKPMVLEPIYIPKETKTVVVENPCVKIEHPKIEHPIILPQLVTVTQSVILPVTIPSNQIGFVQVDNPVFYVVSNSRSDVTHLPRIVPNLVRF
jgi:hypothetical protein